ncbi:MAG: YcxB family protein [Bacilli bacterium]|nr:YcxB family protein [Bacilli bacterium]
MIQVGVHYTEQELQKFFQFQLLIKNKIRYLYMGFAILFLLVSLYFFIWTENTLLGIVLDLFAILMIFMFPIQVKLIVRKQNFKQYEGPIHYLQLSDEGITQKIGEQSNYFSWSDIIEVNETKRCFYLYISKHGAFIVNKSSFIEGTADELTTLLKRHQKKIIRYKYM